MTAAAVGLSHSPLIGKNDPEPEVLARASQAVENARAFVREFGPELVVLFAPDHYNGFFYHQMPPFCLATEAHSVGDFGSGAGPLSVNTKAAKALAQGVLDRGVDLTISARMTVDHGFTQPLEVLFGGIDRVPVVPVFVDGVATPLGPVGRIRVLGTAIGQASSELGKRVLFLASGGLSHDPPVPVLEGAPPRVADALIEGHPPTPEQRARGEQRVVQAGRLKQEVQFTPVAAGEPVRTLVPPGAGPVTTRVSVFLEVERLFVVPPPRRDRRAPVWR
jgi:2,3-dihydroxyphenylpropionate 1,2-dioxygenase